MHEMASNMDAIIAEAISAIHSGDLPRFERVGETCRPSPLKGALYDYSSFVIALGGFPKVQQAHIDLIVQDIREMEGDPRDSTHLVRFKKIVEETGDSIAQAVVELHITDSQASEILNNLTYCGPISLELLAKQTFFQALVKASKEKPDLLSALAAEYPTVMRGFQRSFEDNLGKLPEKPYNAARNPFMDTGKPEFEELAEWGRASLAYQKHAGQQELPSFLDDRIGIAMSSRANFNGHGAPLAHRLMLFSNALRTQQFLGVRWTSYDPSGAFFYHIIKNLDDAMRDRDRKRDLVSVARYASTNVVGGQQDDPVFLNALAMDVCSLFSSQSSIPDGYNLKRLSYLLEIGGEQLVGHPFVRNLPERYPVFFSATLPTRASSGNRSAQIILNEMGMRRSP